MAVSCKCKNLSLKNHFRRMTDLLLIGRWHSWKRTGAANRFERSMVFQASGLAGGV